MSILNTYYHQKSCVIKTSDALSLPLRSPQPLLKDVAKPIFNSDPRQTSLSIPNPPEQQLPLQQPTDPKANFELFSKGVEEELSKHNVDNHKKFVAVQLWMMAFNTPWCQLNPILQSCSRNIDLNLAKNALIEAIKACPKEVLNNTFYARVAGMNYGQITPLHVLAKILP